MMYFFDGIIVVEGTGDSSFLSSFIDALYIETNGFDLNDKEIDFLSHSSKRTIILTDSDEAGKIIRKNILKQIPDAISVEVDLKRCNKNGKHGVAECDKEEIIKSLNKYLTTTKSSVGSIKNSDLIDAGVCNKTVRKYICDELHLGVCNQKELLNRINRLGIDIKDLRRAAKNYYGN